MTLHWRDLTSARRTRLPAVRGAVARPRLLAALDARYPTVTSAADLVAAVAAAAERTPPGQWIRAFGMDVVAGLCEKLRAGGAPGLHFYTMNQSAPTLELLARLKLR